MSSHASTAGVESDLSWKVQGLERELMEARQQQVATSEILRVISRSQANVQPVFDAILASAVRLLRAYSGTLTRLVGDQIELVALTSTDASGDDILKADYPRSLKSEVAHAQAIHDRAPINIADAQTDPRVPEAVRAIARARGYRSWVTVPLLRCDEAVGTIGVTRREPGGFNDDEISLLQTFADQAIIAIENTRLFEEVQARNRELRTALEQQTATSELLKVIGRSTFDLQPVFETLAENAVRLLKGERAFIYRFDGQFLRVVATHNASAEMRAFVEQNPIAPGGDSATARAALERRTIHVLDAQADPDYTYGSRQVDPFRTIMTVPILRANELLGAIGTYRHEVRAFTPNQIALLETFADQAGIAIENTRLFEEVQARTRELAKTVNDLEIASQHKSQFVANMSHELRTPLAAILGYAELMQEGFYEPLGQKSLDALTRIRSNGKHLLGLINTVLDIAKIESGQFTLNMAEYAIESVVETVRSATESLAQNKKLNLKTEVAKSLPVGLGDEQRLTQVLLNLVGNAIKFTDAGEVRVAARAVNGHFAVSVTDTGPGIPPEEQSRIFEQFHQVDSSLTKAKGGTGLGLAIAKQIVEMHGGRIWVESTVGKGSTFQMEIPTRAEFRKRAL